MKLEAAGEKDGKQKEMTVQLYHEDGYCYTAIPVVACLLQYLDGSIKKPGLQCMGQICDPQRLFRDMERLGIRIKIKIEGATSRNV